MKTRIVSSLAFTAALLLSMAPMATFATDLADSDCYSPKANGGLGYCGPSQVCVLVHLPFPRHFEKAMSIH